MDFAEVLRRRRMVRAFRPDPIPADVLDRVLGAARRAPAAGNSDGIDLVVLEGPAADPSVLGHHTSRRTAGESASGTRGCSTRPYSPSSSPTRTRTCGAIAEPDKARTGSRQVGREVAGAVLDRRHVVRGDARAAGGDERRPGRIVLRDLPTRGRAARARSACPTDAKRSARSRSAGPTSRRTPAAGSLGRRARRAHSTRSSTAGIGRKRRHERHRTRSHGPGVPPGSRRTPTARSSAPVCRSTPTANGRTTSGSGSSAWSTGRTARARSTSGCGPGALPVAVAATRTRACVPWASTCRRAWPRKRVAHAPASTATRPACRSPDDVFDRVLAPHMLYHCPDIPAAIAGAAARAATRRRAGRGHQRARPSLRAVGRVRRGHRHAAELLRRSVRSRQRRRALAGCRSTTCASNASERTLLVTEAQPVVDYLASTFHFADREDDGVLDEIRRRVQARASTPTACSGSARAAVPSSAAEHGYCPAVWATT